MRLEEKSSLALVDFLCQNRSDKKEFVSQLRVRRRGGVGLSSPDQSARTQSSASVVLTSQQLFGEENSRRKHGSSLQRPAPQARVSQVTAQSKSSAAHGYLVSFFSPSFHTPEFARWTNTSSLTLPTVNSAGETALDAARRLQHTQCIELVSVALAPVFVVGDSLRKQLQNSSISSRKCKA